MFDYATEKISLINKITYIKAYINFIVYVELVLFIIQFRNLEGYLSSNWQENDIELNNFSLSLEI